MLEVAWLPVPQLDREHGAISQRLQPRQAVPGSKRFDNIFSAVQLHRDPCMSRSVATGPAVDKPRAMTQLHQLSPCPQREIVAVALASLLELMRRHPMIAHPELFFVGEVAALL